MKWGIRRYQNPDGSLTAAGKRRYKTGDNLSKLSDDELRSYISRKNLEKQYMNLKKSEYEGSKKAKEYVKTILLTSGKAVISAQLTKGMTSAIKIGNTAVINYLKKLGVIP